VLCSYTTSQHIQNASKEYDLPAAHPAAHPTAVHTRVARSKSLGSADDFSSDSMLLTSQAIAVGAGALQLTSTSVASPGSSVRKHRQHSAAVVAGSSLVTSSIKVCYGCKRVSLHIILCRGMHIHAVYALL
jgi:hypothetical protein